MWLSVLSVLVSLQAAGVCHRHWSRTGAALRLEGWLAAHTPLLTNNLYFLLQCSHIKPRVTLDASPHKRAIYSLSYNPKR